MKRATKWNADEWADLIHDANLGADARAAAGHYPGTPAELIEQLRRELDSALQREVEALRKAADFKTALDKAFNTGGSETLPERYTGDPNLDARYSGRDPRFEPGR